jgi:hypothetical protein
MQMICPIMINFTVTCSKRMITCNCGKWENRHIENRGKCPQVKSSKLMMCATLLMIIEGTTYLHSSGNLLLIFAHLLSLVFLVCEYLSCIASIVNISVECQ